MAKLLVEKGANKGAEITVGKIVFAGRDTSAHIVLSEPMISRLHFKVEQRPDGYYVVDLESLNGIYVNRARTSEKLLKPGDMIQAGETLFSFISEESAETTQQKDIIGKIVGGYSILQRIGRGGMGTVYKALQISLNRTVALKILSGDMIKDKTFIEMFFREARASAQLNHSNIVQVYDVGRVPDDIYYFSMEFMSGGSIQELLVRKQRLNPYLATKIMLDAAKGLSFAEKKGIVHRDIKPDNLMLGEEEIVKIGDLGLAKSMSSPSAEQSGTLMGTPHYLAPEQAQGKSVDHRADIYSLGASFYRVLTGMTPYSAPTVKEIIQKKLKEDPKPLKEVLPSLPDSVVEVVDKMMKRNVEERYQSATNLIKDIERLKDELNPERAKAIAEVVPGKEKEPQVRKSLVLRLVIPLAILLIALLIIFLIFYQPSKPEPTKEPAIISDTQRAPPIDTGLEYEERLASEYLSKAQGLENRLNPEKKDTISETIQAYERIVKECPRSRLVSQAQTKIASLKKLLESAEQRERERETFRQQEKEALSLLNNLKEKFNTTSKEVIAGADIQRAEIFVNSSINQLEDFKRQYLRFQSVTDAVDESKRNLSNWYKSVLQAGEKYQNLKGQVESSITNEQFGVGIQLIKQFIENPNHKNTVYDNIAKNYLAEIKSRAERSFLALMKKVEELKSKNQLIEVHKLLRDAQGFYGIEEIENIIQKELQEVESNPNYIALVLKGEETVFTENMAGLFWMLQGGQFSTWDKTKVEALSKLKAQEFRDEFSNAVDFMEMEKNILVKFIDKLSKGEFAGKDILLLNKEVSHITNDEISFKGKASPMKLYEMSGLDWVNCISAPAWDLTAKDLVELGILSVKRAGNTTKAGELFKKARLKKLDKETSAFLKRYNPAKDDFNKRLEELKNAREREASLFKKEADRLYNNRQFPSSRTIYLLIKHRYTNTLTYLSNKNEIDIRSK
ncbi:MAG: FHA domain-containing serine/threonine-protein kinase [Planctomycetota bacterium]|nr:FHA domain-containing serine/threonine-protein kinase [Planctomycetota bacterium]MDI6786993.1 FHA domain-containing serine/threonine-protein kinase [Planctomycetota bacterium]